MILLQLFLSFVQIGLFSIGGGYVAIPLIQSQTVDLHHWLTAEQFMDLATIAEMTPGPIAINAATFVGNQVAGIPGALVATAGVILPSCIFVTVLAWLYKRFRKMALMQGVLKSLRPAVVAMIFAAGLGILLATLFSNGTISFAFGNFQYRALVLFLVALVCLRGLKWNPILVMAGCGVVELLAQVALR